MNRQRIVWLLIAAAAIVALTLWVAGSREGRRAATDGEIVLNGLRSALNDVTEIRISKGDGSAITLQRQTSGWRVKQRDYAADTGRIRKLLLALADLEIRERKTRNPANYSKLGVEDANTPAATSTLLEVVAPKQTWSLLVGRQNTPRSGFARVVGQAESVLVEPLITVETEVKSWLDRQVVDLPAKQVKSVNITPETGGTYTLVRAKPDDDNLTLANLSGKERLSSPAAANSAAEALTALTFDDVRKRADTVSASLKAEYQLTDGSTLVIHGARVDGRAYISLSGNASAASRAAGWEYEIPTWKFDPLFRARSALLAP